MIRHVVTDIEGTTTPVAFVHAALFPHARAGLAAFVATRGAEPAVRRALDEAKALAGEPLATDAAIVATLLRWTDEDRKATPLKTLQGLVWEDGYARGLLVAPVFDDVPPALRAWRARGLALHVYSSGSVRAQQLLFAHTTHGDLRPHFTRYFDTETGGKREPASYVAIAAALEARPEEVLFLSDVAGELDAARETGMRCVGVVREGAAAPAGHASATTFADVVVDER